MISETKSRRLDLRIVAAVLASSFLPLVPALLHGTPFVFLDTQQYFLIGQRIIQTLFGGGGADTALQAVAGGQAGAAPTPEGGGLAAIAGGRSPIYAVFIYVVSTVAGMWVAAWLQTLICSTIIFRFCAMIWARNLRASLTCIGLLTLFSSLGFHATFMMPDVFAGCMALTLAIFLFSPSVGRIEATLLLLASLAFATMHASNILLVASALVAVAIIRLVERAPIRPMLLRLGAVVGVAAVAAIFSSAYVVAVRAATGDEVRSLPYLTARVIGDGTGERYLANNCKGPGQPFVACIYAGKDFESQDEFLSSKTAGGYISAEPATKVELSNQDVRFALAVTAYDPAGQFAASFSNFAQTLVRMGIYEVSYGLKIFAELPDWRQSEVIPFVPGGPACIADSRTCEPAAWTHAWQWEVAVVGIGSLIVFVVLAVWLALASRKNGTAVTPAMAPAVRAAFFLALLVVANAAICGVFSGVHDRYQARVGWTLLLALAALLPTLRALLRAQGGDVLNAALSVLPVQPADKRFFLASVGAFGADLLLALALREGLQLSVTLSATISFVVVWISAYFVHEYWTFRHAESRVSADRLARNLAANGAALACRVAVVFVLEVMHAPDSAVLAGLYIITGAGCSFCLNYLLNRFWVFSRR
ncbi:MAG: GtrA family protein [Hyphomonadaceae bacterium]